MRKISDMRCTAAEARRGMLGPNIGGGARLCDPGRGCGVVEKLGDGFALVEGPAESGHRSAVFGIGDLQTVPQGSRLFGHEITQVCRAIISICEVRCGGYACVEYCFLQCFWHLQLCQECSESLGIRVRARHARLTIQGNGAAAIVA